MIAWAIFAYRIIQESGTQYMSVTTICKLAIKEIKKEHINFLHNMSIATLSTGSWSFFSRRLEFGHYQQFPSQVLPERHIQKAVQKMLRCMLKESRLIWVFDSYGKTQVQSRRDGRINQNEKVDRPTWERNQL